MSGSNRELMLFMTRHHHSWSMWNWMVGRMNGSRTTPMIWRIRTTTRSSRRSGMTRNYWNRKMFQLYCPPPLEWRNAFGPTCQTLFKKNSPFGRAKPMMLYKDSGWPSARSHSCSEPGFDRQRAKSKNSDPGVILEPWKLVSDTKQECIGSAGKH